jgi:hypothetical protein
VPALGDAALKTGSECSFTTVNSASSPVFALPDLRSATFRAEPVEQKTTVARFHERSRRWVLSKETRRATPAFDFSAALY